jgi:hypothetical protein
MPGAHANAAGRLSGARYTVGIFIMIPAVLADLPYLLSVVFTAAVPVRTTAETAQSLPICDAGRLSSRPAAVENLYSPGHFVDIEYK